MRLWTGSVMCVRWAGLRKRKDREEAGPGRVFVTVCWLVRVFQWLKWTLRVVQNGSFGMRSNQSHKTVLKWDILERRNEKAKLDKTDVGIETLCIGLCGTLCETPRKSSDMWLWKCARIPRGHNCTWYSLNHDILQEDKAKCGYRIWWI